MNCRDLEEMLSAYADGELSLTQQEFIEEHLSGCAECRKKLAQFEATGQLLSALAALPEAPDIKDDTLSKIKMGSLLLNKSYRLWIRPAIAALTIIAIFVVFLLTQPWNIKTPEAMAASIVRNSPEVQAALDGEEITEIEITTKIVDDNGEVLAVIVKTERGKSVAAEVDIENKKVEQIVHVHVPELHPDDKQKAIEIVQADPRIQELLALGAVIKEVSLGHSLHIGTDMRSDGQICNDTTATKTASVNIELKGKQWIATVNLDEGIVMGLGKQVEFPSVLLWILIIASFILFLSAAIILGRSVIVWRKK